MSITFVDNSDEILRALGEACERGLFRCGEKAVEYAKDLCPVDTGNLRNSITHTVEDEKSHCWNAYRIRHLSGNGNGQIRRGRRRPSHSVEIPGRAGDLALDSWQSGAPVY